METQSKIKIAARLNNGRTGNQLWQMSAAMGLAEQLNGEAIFPSSWPYFRYFKGPFNVVTDADVTHLYHESFFHHSPFDWAETIKLKDNQPPVVEMMGYFQSQKYWSHCREKILSAFEFQEFFKKENQDSLAQISRDIYSQTEENPILISIHFRYGDYINNSYYADLNIGDYYETAISFFLKQNHRCAFVCFSDDKELMGERITRLSKVFNTTPFIEVTGGAEIRDLYLQSCCSHNIVANSSFSYWAHLLNKNTDKVGVFPKLWFGPNTVLNTNDLYPNKAIII